MQRLFNEFCTALASPAIQSRLTAMCTETVGMPSDEFTRVFHADLQRWAKFVRETGLRLD